MRTEFSVPLNTPLKAELSKPASENKANPSLQDALERNGKAQRESLDEIVESVKFLISLRK